MKRIRALTATILTILILATTATMAHASPQTDWLNAASTVSTGARDATISLQTDVTNRDNTKVMADSQRFTTLVAQWTALPPAPSELSQVDRYMGRALAYSASASYLVADGMNRSDANEIAAGTVFIQRATDDFNSATAAVQAML